MIPYRVRVCPKPVWAKRHVSYEQSNGSPLSAGASCTIISPEITRSSQALQVRTSPPHHAHTPFALSFLMNRDDLPRQARDKRNETTMFDQIRGRFAHPDGPLMMIGERNLSPALPPHEARRDAVQRTIATGWGACVPKKSSSAILRCVLSLLGSAQLPLLFCSVLFCSAHRVTWQGLGCTTTCSPSYAKTVVLSHLHLYAIVLPRQARDKHRENTPKSLPFSQVKLPEAATVTTELCQVLVSQHEYIITSTMRL
jgi:hypothetical protein